MLIGARGPMLCLCCDYAVTGRGRAVAVLIGARGPMLCPVSRSKHFATSTYDSSICCAGSRHKAVAQGLPGHNRPSMLGLGLMMNIGGGGGVGLCVVVCSGGGGGGGSGVRALVRGGVNRVFWTWA